MMMFQLLAHERPSQQAPNVGSVLVIGKHDIAQREPNAYPM